MLANRTDWKFDYLNFIKAILKLSGEYFFVESIKTYNYSYFQLLFVEIS